MNNQKRLFQSVTSAFGIGAGPIGEESSQDTVRGWDSVTMVRLVAELEAEFRVQFSLLEVADFYNVGLIQSILLSKGVVFE